MATSGTYAFQPSIGEIVLLAYSRCQVRRTSLLAEHMTDARLETNLMLVDWSVQSGPNLWTVELVTQALTANTATYAVDAATIMILDAYISPVSGSDRIIWPVSRTEYAAQSDKTTAGTPTTFWFDRLIAPTITLWQPPSNSTDILKYYRCRHVQDANPASGQTPEIPYRWYSAFADGLTARLAAIYRPEVAETWERKAQRSYSLAAGNDVENVPLMLTPMLGVYRA